MPEPGAAHRATALIDDFLPEYQFAEQHSTHVRAPVERVYSAILTLNLSQSSLIRLLFRARGLPESALTLKGLLRTGFIWLGERPNEELVLGLIGRFWAPSGDLQSLDAEEFRGFSKPGFARAVWNFRLRPVGQEQIELSTETRVQCLDAAALQRFRIYWLFVGPFSGLIRRVALRVIQAEAEGPVSAEDRAQ